MTRKFLTPLQLPTDPTQPMEAATKQYVDARGYLPTRLRLSKATGTVATGDVTITGWTTSENTGGWTVVSGTGVCTVPADGYYTIFLRFTDTGGMSANIFPIITTSAGNRIGPICTAGTTLSSGTEMTAPLTAGQTLSFTSRNSSGGAVSMAFTADVVRVSL